PALEFVRVFEMEAVQERAVVQRRCLLELSTCDVTLESRAVAGYAGGVQPQLGGSGHDLGASDVAFQFVERLTEDVPRLFLVAVRPEARNKLRSTHSAMASNPELHQHGHDARLE